jgi:hypothetical protein
MNRLFFLKKLFRKKNFKTYLEIGVFTGRVFFSVPAHNKIAVDPEFRFTTSKKIKKVFRRFSNLWAKFYEKTSDDFFADDASNLFQKNKIDVALVDGMHEYNYALRDIENSLKFLQREGVVFVHDCNPETREASVSFEEYKKRGFIEDWNGDVWKAIVHLRSLRNDVNVFVLDCDQGLGIVSFGKSENKLNFTREQIAALTYEQFNENRKEWLNLKEPSYFFDYFGIKR